MPRPVASVIGAGETATDADCANAFRVGQLLAEAGWAVVNGGRDFGVMRHVNRGVRAAGGMAVGIVSSADRPVCPEADVVVVTEMHNARNNIVVLSGQVVIACGDGGPGTVSEIALAVKAGKPVILLGANELSQAFFGRLGGDQVTFATTAEEAVAMANAIRSRRPGD
ncbi:MAG: cytochrome [Gemmataceae bacterium]